jgi:hypothetical protein
MIPADRQKFVEVVLGFAELKSKQLSTPALELYWRSLQHWPLEDFLAAAEQLVRTSEFMPTPKDFEDLRKAGRRTAGEAWMLALEYARHSHSAPYLNGSSTPDDELMVRAVRAIGGFRAIAMSDVDKTQFLERRFCEHYEAMKDAEDVRAAVPQIAYAGRPQLSGPQSVRHLLGGPIKS